MNVVFMHKNINIKYHFKENNLSGDDYKIEK